MIVGRKSVGSRIFDVGLYLFMLLFCLGALYPFWHLVVISLSSPKSAVTTLRIWPDVFSSGNYRTIITNRYIWMGYRNTIIRTVLGTFLQLTASICAAYPLSKKFLPNRTLWTGIIIFTMFFSGGLIPSYLLVRNLNLINRIWALILPGLVPTYSMIIMRNFFMALPESLEESARIDGANDILILQKIVLPLSTPILATVGLWSVVAHWNAWFDSLIYITDVDKQVVQVVLRRIIIQGTVELIDTQPDEIIFYEGVKAAAVMAVTVPILCVYPFIQKYFVKGIMIGSLKG